MNKVAVIILNYNDYENTLRICKEYEKMKVIDKIIVVDNKSTNNSYHYLKKLKSNKVDVIQTKENKGYACGNNKGIYYLNKKYGHFDYLIISNPDIYIKENAVKACINYLIKNENIAICAPKMLMKNGEEHPISGWKLRSIRGDLWDSSILLTKIFKKPHIEMYDVEYMKQDTIEVDCVAGSFFVIKDKIFNEINYFDEHTFLYYEEDIIGKKIYDLGYKNVILNKYKFTHLESVSVDTSMSFMKKYMNLQKSKIYYHKNYNERMNIFSLCLFYFFTYFRYVEQFCSIVYRKVYPVVRFVLHYVNALFYRIVKLLLFLLAIITLPIFKIFQNKKKSRIFYFSVVDWKWIKQRPHFVPLFLCNNGYKVDYYFESPYDKYILNQSNVFVENEHLNDHLKIKKWKYFPYHVKKFHFNRYIFLLRSFFLNYNKVIFTNPKQIKNIFIPLLKLRGIDIYYECMDNYDYWEDKYSIDLFHGLEACLIKIASKVIVSSEGLKQMFIKRYNCELSKLVLIRNGYDKEVFENICSTPLKLKHPNAVYIGTIDEWFDFDSIIQYAKNNTNTYFYIIGPVGWTVKDKIGKMDYKNIIFTGPIEHKYVPDTIKNSDVMLLPFILNELIEDVDPVKVYEYLYMKKPVVSSYWKELDQFAEFVDFYHTSKDFNDALTHAFRKKIKDTKNYKKLMFESAWEERLKKYLEAIK